MLCLWKTVILAIHLDLIEWPHHDRDEEREVLNHRTGKIKGFSLRLEDAQVCTSGLYCFTCYLQNSLRCQIGKLFRLSQNVNEGELSSLQTLAQMRFNTSNQIW